MSHFKAPPKKQLGQHFLADRGVIAQILLAIDPRPGERLVEIGPGQGAITFPLLRRQGELTVIEFDRDLIEPLTQAAQAHGSLHVIHRDVLQVDFAAPSAGPSQLTERLIGTWDVRRTLPFNGYGEQVAGLYAGMDLRRWF